MEQVSRTIKQSNLTTNSGKKKQNQDRDRDRNRNEVAGFTLNIHNRSEQNERQVEKRKLRRPHTGPTSKDDFFFLTIKKYL